MAVLAVGANSAHGLAHAGQSVISLPIWQWFYVTTVVYLAPIAAAILLPRSGRKGAWLLLLSMAGAFVFDLTYHFVVPGPDNVFSLRAGAWRAPFVGSAVLVSLLSGVGALIGARLLSESPRSPVVPARSTADLAATRSRSSKGPR